MKNKIPKGIIILLLGLSGQNIFAQGVPDYTTTSGIEYATQPVVHAVDANGNIDADYIDNVEMSTWGDGVVGGNTTVSAQNGVVSFTDLKYTDSRDNATYNLVARTDSFGTSQSHDILSDIKATKYIFTTQPAPTTIPKDIVVDFTTDPVVKAVDANDHVDTDNSDLISITAGSIGTTLTNNQAQAVNGVATFTGLTINHHAYETLTLQAYGNSEGFRTSSDSLTVAYSAPTITSTPTTTSTSNSLYNYVLGATNVGVESLTWTVASGTTLPSWLSLKSELEVTTIAGSGSSGSTDATGVDASFNLPMGVAMNSNGILFVVDDINHLIRKITPNGEVTTFAGSGTSGDVDANGINASFNYPIGIAIDSNDNIFIADKSNSKIRKITPNGDVSTFATIHYPQQIAIDSNNTMFVSAWYQHNIYKITSSGVVTTFAGSGTSGDVDANGINASFNNPTGIAIDSIGTLFVSESGNNKIRKITPNGDVTTFAGSGARGSVDANGVNASFNGPYDLAIDKLGNLFVADRDNSKIRKITPSGDVTTFASSYSNTGGINASLNNPAAIMVANNGDIIVTDTFNHQIKKIVTTITTLTGTPTCSDLGEHTIALTLSDGTTSLDHNFTLTITDDGTCNTAPTASAVSFTIDEDTSKTFTANDFNFTDVDVGDTLESIFITTLQSEGNLTLSGTAVTLNQEITTANISNLVFSPVANTYGTPYATFGFTVNDGEANSTSAYVATINVNEVVKDIDGDGINDDVDPNLNDGPLADYDNDSILNQDDPDDDNDGYDDGVDDFPFDKTEWLDTDSDGTGDNADSDDDNDGISDADEERLGFDPLDASDGGNTDTDGDGVSNADEIEAGSDPLDPNDTKKLKKFLPILIDGMTSVVPLP